MRKLLIQCIAVIVLLTSCSDDELLNMTNNNANSIFFATDINVSSRAIDIDNTNLGDKDVANGFAVTGYTKGDDETTWQKIFADEHVTGSGIGEAGNWSYVNLQYWVAGNSYHFHAISPYGDDNVTDQSLKPAKMRHWAISTECDNKAYINITFDNVLKNSDGSYDAAGEQDLIYSYRSAVGLASNNPKVGLTFHHLLSRVKFKFTGDESNSADLPISVTNISITDTYAKGGILFTNVELDGKSTIDATPWSVFNEDRTALPFGATLSDFTTGTSYTDHKYVIPDIEHAVAYNTEITFSYNGNEYTKTVTLPKVKMSKGASYLYDITVKASDDNLEIVQITADEETPIGSITSKENVQLYDYAMCDGSFERGTLTDEQKQSCVGVVFWLNNGSGQKTTALSSDKALMQDYPDCTHGLIVSLKNLTYDGSKDMSWQGLGKVFDTDSVEEKYIVDKEDVYNIYQKLTIYDSEPYLPIQPTTTEDGTIQLISGYNNSKVLKAYNTQTASIMKPVAALSALSDVPNFSCWYVPSIKELSLLNGKDLANIFSFTSTINVGYANKDKVNKALYNLGDYAELIAANPKEFDSVVANTANDYSEGLWSSSELGYTYYSLYVSIANIKDSKSSSYTKGCASVYGMKCAYIHARAVCAF
jgi:hypothetical protein